MRGSPAAGLAVKLERREPDGDWKQLGYAIKDLTVTIALAGDFAETHISGDNSKVVPTDTQKNTVFAFAREPIGEIEDFGLRLARHFVSEFASVYRARVHIDEASWSHINV